MKQVIDELLPIPKRNLTSELPKPATSSGAVNYFSRTGMMFFPDEARAADKPEEGALDRTTEKKLSPSSANSSDYLGQNDDIDSMINPSRE